MKTTDFKELVSLYFEKEQDFNGFEDVAAERDNADKELAKLVPDVKLQDDIRDCFGMSLELNQRQGFIHGFQYATKLFLEAQGATQTGVCGNE